MIEARPIGWFKRWFGGQVEKRLRRSFYEVRVRGLDQFRRLTAAGPTLVVSNHTSWWDSMFCIYLSTRLADIDGYAMMEASNLRRLPFLGRLGGFGVDRRSPHSARSALRYAAKLLNAAGRVVWIFPQGRERPITERPLGFLRGAEIVARLAANSRTIPVALRYEFGEHEKPVLLVSIGAPLHDTSCEAQEHAVTAELDRIDESLRAGVLEPYRVVLRHDSSWLARFLEATLAKLTRYRSALA